MHARVTTIEAEPDRFDDGIRLYRESGAEISGQQGFQEAVLLVNRDTGNGMSITLWESEDALNESVGTFQRVSQRVGEALRGEPRRQTYEVLERRAGQNRKYARVSTGTLQAGRYEEMARQEDTSLIDAASRQPGYSGFLILGDRSNSKIIGISFWDSMEHLEASQGGSGYYEQEMDKTRDQWEGGWEREVLEVAVDL